MDFKKEAKKYANVGLSPIPIMERKKRPAINKWQEYCDRPPTDKELDEWGEKYPNSNIGLALGTKTLIENTILIAIDVDDDELIDPVLYAVGKNTSSKVGKKGLTIFGLADPKIQNTKLKRMIGRTPAPRPSVEILCHGSQTVVPPSVHPETLEPYTWDTSDLLDVKPGDLPVISKSVIDEIVAICHDKADHFNNLNTMVWLGVDGGGNTHDTCVSAAANLVARGWEDHDIHTRIERAKLEACVRAGEEYNWPGSSKAIQGWINSARDKGMTDNAKPKKKIPPERVMANWLIDEFGGEDNVRCVQGILRGYKDGHWPKIDLNSAMKDMYATNEMLTQREAKAARDIAHTLTDVRNFGYTPNTKAKDDIMRQRVCLKNGTLNLMTGELEKHDPDHQLIHQLDFEWNDEAECPLYNKVLEETFNADQKAIDLWNEYCAHSLIPDTSFQKLLFLKGPGGNGKGTVARVLRNMHDPDAIGSVGITDLNDERKRTSLVGKLLNISGEQSRLNLVSDTYLKKITGEDPIDIRKLYGETENNVVLGTRFLELVNEMPATSDSSGALRRRIMILVCPRKVINADTDLDRKLREERPGILRLWVSSLRALYERGGFAEPDSSHEEADQYMLENDPVAYWRTERITSDAKGTPSKELYADYKEWGQAMGYKNVLNEVTWGRKLTALGYESKVRKVGDSSVRVRKLAVRKGLGTVI
jgi:P4 family phage/plasmid primase-like protien